MADIRAISKFVKHVYARNSKEDSSLLPLGVVDENSKKMTAVKAEEAIRTYDADNPNLSMKQIKKIYEDSIGLKFLELTNDTLILQQKGRDIVEGSTRFNKGLFFARIEHYNAAFMVLGTIIGAGILGTAFEAFIRWLF